MKKRLLGLAVISIFIGSVLTAGVPLNKQHKGKIGLGGDKINCVYCHKKAGNPKTKGNDLKKLKEGKYCKMSNCH